jgi:hypothetical protein
LLGYGFGKGIQPSAGAACKNNTFH